MDYTLIIADHLPWIIGAALGLGLIGTFGWIHTTRLKIKHGYPLEGMWGQSLEPTGGGQMGERLQQLTQENAELRVELDAVKNRMANVELIVTDSGYQLGNEIENLRLNASENSSETATVTAKIKGVKAAPQMAADTNQGLG